MTQTPILRWESLILPSVLPTAYTCCPAPAVLNNVDGSATDEKCIFPWCSFFLFPFFWFWCYTTFVHLYFFSGQKVFSVDKNRSREKLLIFGEGCQPVINTVFTSSFFAAFNVTSFTSHHFSIEKGINCQCPVKKKTTTKKTHTLTHLKQARIAVISREPSISADMTWLCLT